MFNLNNKIYIIEREEEGGGEGEGTLCRKRRRNGKDSM